MNNKKALVALVLVALVGVVGATFAYFTSSTTLNNEFQTGTYSTIVKDKFVSPDNWTPGTTTTKKVNVTNKGSVEVAVRASYTETWTSVNGRYLDGARMGEKVAQFTTGSDWEKATDGYYYYKETLGTNETSTDFISSVTFNPNFKLEEGVDIECTTTNVNGKITIDCVNLKTGYAGATYSLDVTIETIQADQKWQYTLSESVTPNNPQSPSTTTYEVGDEIIIETVNYDENGDSIIKNEVFNVIKDNGNTVTMLAQFNIGDYVQQSEQQAYSSFSQDGGWKYTPGPKEINVELYGDSLGQDVSYYVYSLRRDTGDSALTGTVITLAELKELGCTINDDYHYSYADTLTCTNSQYKDWLVNGQTWWTRSASANDPYDVWYVRADGYLRAGGYDHSDGYYHITSGTRPVITVSKATLENL